MKSGRNRVAWFAFALLAVAIGLYPLAYYFSGEEMGLLTSKSEELLADTLWNTAFYGHISFGGLSLLIGWTQFSRKLRTRHLSWHRTIGKIYVGAALLSRICAIYLSFFATGGLVPGLGFFLLGVFWIFFTLRAYTAIRKRDISAHEAFMIYSYAACFAAVCLRLWMPLLIIIFGEFLIAYKIVAWLCWVPNLIFAYFWVRRKGLQIE